MKYRIRTTELYRESPKDRKETVGQREYLRRKQTKMFNVNGNMNLQTENTQVLSKENKNHIQTHVVKLKNSKDEEKFSKATRGKNTDYLQKNNYQTYSHVAIRNNKNRKTIE